MNFTTVPTTASLDLRPLTAINSSIKPQLLDSILQDSYRSKSRELSFQHGQKWNDILGQQIDVYNLHLSLSNLIRYCLFHHLDTVEAITALFPPGFDQTIATSLSTGIAARLPDWHELAIASLPGPPKLLSFDWKVQDRVSSAQLARLNASSINVTMALQSSSNTAVERVSFEMSRPALATMLTGLERISEQLESMQ